MVALRFQMLHGSRDVLYGAGVLSFVLTTLFTTNISAQDYSSYAQCILDRMVDIDSDAAAAAIVQACKSLTSSPTEEQVPQVTWEVQTLSLGKSEKPANFGVIW